MKYNILKVIRIMLFFVSILFFLIGFLFNDLNILLFNVFLILLHNVLFSLEKLKNRLILFWFQITFFVFLVGKPLFIMLNGEDWIHPFSEIVMKHTVISLILSCYSIFLGSYIYSKITKTPNFNLLKEVTFKSKYMVTLRKVSLVLYYITFIAALAVVLEKVIFVQSTDFREYYISYNSNLPIFLVKIGDLCITIFYVYLATLPSKKQSKLPILLYVLYSVVSIGYGQRNDLFLNGILLITYFIIRDYIAKDGIKWFTKKIKYSIFISLPFILIFAVIFDYVRRDIPLSEFEFFALLTEFFISQGGSNEIISYGYILEDRIPSQMVYYSLGSLYIYLTQNMISRAILNIDSIPLNTVEMALTGNSFGHTITYLVYPKTYLEGIGMGSSYIAELYYDFGYIGIVCGGLFLGMLFPLIIKVMIKKWWLFALSLIMIRGIIFIPRATYFGWFTDAFSILNIFTIILLWFIAKFIYEKKYKG
ncbi:O-antigen polysaccharide polymerase Wzy family protein [Ureibacillus chungkukjangi]|uniref:O-antigen polysaccharide polymerase Wzy family protein n=1 Tax=Ureibacillus chungkukjangi TaxID=1202712 RepID=UPI00203B8245|nr:O-antigen polysaccharide polymerase Wzy family protein [Ureibacillus chungkukjangi]MCM3386845.1 O-antigen polysaccharide polymerase Wzy family protein [Ureibacillus chungkukjangi]